MSPVFCLKVNLTPSSVYCFFSGSFHMTTMSHNMFSKLLLERIFTELASNNGTTSKREICAAGTVSANNALDRIEDLKASTDSVQRISVPHVGIPSLEPASEGGRLCTLLNGGDGNSLATRGV